MLNDRLFTFTSSMLNCLISLIIETALLQCAYSQRYCLSVRIYADWVKIYTALNLLSMNMLNCCQPAVYGLCVNE